MDFATRRASDASAFSADELDFVSAVADHLGEGLRHTLARTSLGEPVRERAGTLVEQTLLDVVELLLGQGHSASLS